MTRLPYLGRAAAVVAVVLASWFALPESARAGGGPETTLVVVNAASPTSLRVANEYVRLRDIPPSHVLYLDDVPAAPVVPVDIFRGKILDPIERHLLEQGIRDDVDLIAYSTGFPYAVDFSADLTAKKIDKPGRLVRNRHASLTGLTYLYRRVLAIDPEGYLDENVNGYFRKPENAGGTRERAASPKEARLERDAQGALGAKDFDRAAEIFQELVRLNPDRNGHWYNLACCYAVLEKKDEALEALETAVEKGFADAEHAAGDADLQGLRDEPAFAKLLEAMQKGGVQPTHGFRNRDVWTGKNTPAVAEPGDETPDRYRLAVMLGWTGAHGNGVDEVLQCLRTSAAADGTRPDGTVYLMWNKDQHRIGPRQSFYSGVIDALRRLGRRTETLEQGKDGEDGVLPKNRDDVIGLVTGKASFRWGDRPRLLPGAIADHLTSFGAHFGTAGQTKCTEFIRHGAAGTSGTVAEPLNAWLKFPIPYVHVHYARGCSMAEAHYQSVWMPYQLLILGDPLARPFARFSEVALATPLPAEPLSGTVALEVKVDAPPGHAPGVLELWVDGVKSATGDPGKPLEWDTTEAADGWHELRLVAVDGDSVQTRSYVRYEAEVANGVDAVEVKLPEEAFSHADEVELRGKAKGALAKVELVRGVDVLAEAEVKGSKWKLQVPARRLGEGTVRLQVRGTTGTGEHVLGRPFEVTVETGGGRHMPAVVAEGDLLPGLRATLTEENSIEHEALIGTLGQGPGRTLRHDLADREVPNPHGLVAEGYLGVDTSGTWEVEVRAAGPVSLSIAGQELVSLDAAPPGGRVFAVIALEAGRHELRIEAKGAGVNRLGVYLSGPEPTRPLAGQALGHLPPETMPASRPAGEKTLLDDDRGGKGYRVPADGIVLEWKRTERNLVGVALHPLRIRGAPAFPTVWTVETRTSARGKWKEVKNLRAWWAPPAEAPRKDQKYALSLVYLAFDKTSARQLRIRPADPADRVMVTEVKVYAKAKRRR